MTTSNNTLALKTSKKGCIQVMGAFAVTDLDGRVLAIGSRKLQLLLAILAFHQGKKISRQEIAAILWSRHAENNALTSLRQSLLRLKNMLGDNAETLLVVERRALALNTGIFHSDIGDLLHACHTARLNESQLQALVEERIFADLVAKDEAERVWLQEARKHLYEKSLHALARQLANTALSNTWRQKLVEARLALEERLDIDVLPSADEPGEPPALREPPPSRLQSYKHYLKNKVSSFWIQDVLNNATGAGGGREPLMDLALTEDSTLVSSPVIDHDTGSNIHPLKLCGRTFKSSEIARLYREANGKLLVAGSPGSGKTTLMLRLVDDLLNGMQHLDDPVPVVIMASSRFSQHQSALDWMVEELDYRYDIPPAIGRELIEGRHLALFVDGIDEVGPALAESIVAALNQMSRLRPNLPMCLFCQTQCYRGMSIRFAALRAATIEPISPSTLREYLARQGVTGNLGKRGHFVAEEDFLSTPLTVHLALMTRPQKDLSEGRLVERYIDTMLDDDPEAASRQYHHLSCLARLMADAGRSVLYLDDFADISLYRPSFQRWIRLLSLSVITCLCVCVVGFYGYQHRQDWISILTPVVLGIVGVGLVSSLGSVVDASLLPRYHYSLTALKHNLSKKLLVIVYAVGALFTSCWWIFGLAYGVAVGLVVSFMFIIYCCLDYYSAAEPDNKFGRPYELMRRTLNNALLGAAIGAMLGALTDSILSGEYFLGLSTVLFPLVVFFILGGHALLQALVARSLLALTGQLPWRFNRFIDHASRRRLLTRVGGGVMFFHRSLLNHLKSRCR